MKGDGKQGNPRTAQAGVEYLLIMALLLVMVTPIFIYAMDMSSISVRTSRSRQTVESIAIAADNICGMGGGSDAIGVYIPYGAEYSYIKQRTIKLGLRIGDGVGEAIAMTRCNVSGQIPLDEGYASVPVRMLQNGTILVG